MRYIGFDMGDGESAVAIYQHGSGIEPIIQPIYGSRSLISAVGTLNGEVVIGEQAYTSTLSEGLSVRFQPEPLSFKRNGATPGKRIQDWRRVTIGGFQDLLVGSREQFLFVGVLPDD